MPFLCRVIKSTLQESVAVGQVNYVLKMNYCVQRVPFKSAFEGIHPYTANVPCLEVASQNSRGDCIIFSLLVFVRQSVNRSTVQEERLDKEHQQLTSAW